MMKKTILFLLVVALSAAVFGQTKNIKIAWNNWGDDVNSVATSTAFSGGVTAKEESYNPLKLQISEERIQFQEVWEDDGYANPSTLQLRNVQYSPLTAKEQTLINKALVEETLTYTIRSSKGRDKIYTLLTVSPIVRRNGTYQKVTSFTVDYSKQRGSLGASSRQPIVNSVLATGNWFKFKVEKTGVQRISKSFLDDLGMDTDAINPRNIKIYGNGGKPMPLQIDAGSIIYDNPEIAIQVVGEQDGSFDANDFILFYGSSTLGYDEENDSHINPYSDDSYYYITADGGSGRRVLPMLEPTQNPTTTFTTYDNTVFFEEDEESPSKLGRRWVSNRFDIENEQTFDFSIPNIASGSDMRVTIRAVASSETNTSMSIDINNTSVDPLTFSETGESLLIDPDFTTVQVPAPGDGNVSVTLNYNNSGNPASIAYLDYIRIQATSTLSGGDGQLAFENREAATGSGVASYELQNASQFVSIWDVTNPQNISEKRNDEGAGNISIKAQLGTVRKYVAIDPNDLYVPVKLTESRVPNQDLKGTIFNDASGNFKDIDYLIVTSPFLIQPALRLATHHKNLNGLNVKVVTTDKIYEEFSSGKQDISAIRNFVKYIYDNASSPNKRIKYLCLFGDTSVDYKNRLPDNNNVVPTFHTLSSRSTVSSFMTDDFFGSVDDGEGTMTGSDRLDIAVGRILADEVGLANAMVNKIITYSSQEAYGNWRNNFVLISDDVDEVYEYEDLEVTLDAIGDQIEAEKPFINVKKIHSDAYQQETSAGGDRYPEVNEAIKNVIDVGSLIITYFGHGGEDGIAKEFIFTKSDGENLRNAPRFPLIVTITCEYTKFDNPLRITAGELIYWNREGGAISLLTTTRSITVTLGVQFNEVLAPYLFGYGTTNYDTPAESLRLAKNEIGDVLRRVVFSIGDPAMKLAFPKPQVRLTTLNDVPIAQATDTLQALSRVKIGGEVLDESGNLMTDYSGVLEAKIFDKKVERQTLGNDGVRECTGCPLLILNFTTLGEGLFNGQASVNNGQFEFEFVVPRDIQIPVGAGRASLYAQRNNSLEDQTGVSFDLQIGGLNENAPEDNEGPLIRLFMNDESFVSGGITNDSPILIAKLEDENGINTASGIGHDMIAILDGDETNPFVLNDYYQGDVDDFTKGETNFKFRDLEKGLHTLTFKAWDVYNNSSTAEIQFVVAGDDELKINRVLNYPNPFVDYTEFWFNHNRPFEPLDVQVQVFTVTGKVVWTKNQIINTDGFLSRDIVWDGRDDFGDRIGKGVYVYKITVKSTLTNKRVEKFEKLVIL